MKNKFYYVIKFFILICLLITDLPIYAGQTGKITGIVKDKKTGEPLIGINVYTEDRRFGATTDISGYYVILNVPPGKYTLLASMTGYQTVKINDVEILADKTTKIDIQIEEQSTVLSQEVVVQAERPLVQKDLTSSELSVGSEQIKNLPVENLNDILQQKAGVITDATGGIHIRGGRTSEVGYLVDGIPVSDNYVGEQSIDGRYAGAQSQSIDVQSMEEVKVISGVFNAEYGQAMSGIVDVITKQGSDKFKANINLSSGDYLTNASNIYIGLDKRRPTSINDIKGNLSGPINLFDSKMSYYLAFRRYQNYGWLYGQRRFNMMDSSFQKGGVYYIQSTGDNKIMSLNSSLNYNFQGKLTFNIASPLRLSDLLIYDKVTSQFYNHFFKYDPNGVPKNHSYSVNNIATLTYVFSSSTYVTLKHSISYKEDRLYVFPDINDPAYADPNLLYQLTAYAFLTGGTDMVHNKRGNTTNIFKLDFESQIDKFNQAKTGFELNLYDIKLANQISRYQGQIKVFDQNAFLNNGYFNFKPLSFAFYVQDKIEFESIIVNAGLRYDYFNSKGEVPSDLRAPEVSAKVKASAKHQVSPRVGIAFPISADGSIHFSYGHFFQVPSFEYYYADPNFRVNPGGLYTLMGNANLKPQSLVAYEVGLHYSFFNMFGVEVIGYFKDLTNLLGTEIHETYVAGDRYALFSNRDYGKTRGLTFSLYKRPTESDHISVSLDYTLQSTEGNASDPNDAYIKTQGNKKLNFQIIPLNWDQTHTINLSVFYIIPGNLNIGLITKYESGFPYTPNYRNSETSYENSARMPSKINVDLQLNKDLLVSDNNSLSLYLKVYNLFDTRNEITVFTDTGRAGYSLVSQYTPEYQGPNTLSEFLTHPEYYSEPRRIVIGLNFNFGF
ncbi:MAG: TonB-dependent receptor [Clostridiales bacterium]